MSHRTILSVAAAVLALAIPAACTSDRSTTAGADSSPSPSATPRDDIEVDFSTARGTPSLEAGRDYRVVADLPTMISGRRAAHYGLLAPRTSLAVTLAASGPPPLGPGGTSVPIGSDELIAYDLDTEAVTILAAHGTKSRPTYFLDATFDDDVIVWAETPDVGELSRWELYAYDRETRRTRHLASDPQYGIGGEPRPLVPLAHPVLADGQVYIAGVAERPGKRPRSAIYRVPVTGGRLTEVIDNSTAVFVDGDDLRFERGTALGTWDVAAGAEKASAAAPVADPCGATFNEGVLAECDSSGSIEITEASGRHTSIRGLRGYPESLNATSRWVGFSLDSKAYLYDLRRGHMFRLAGVDNFPSGRYSGDQLAYIRQGTPPPPGPIPLISLLPG